MFCYVGNFAWNHLFPCENTANSRKSARFCQAKNNPASQSRSEGLRYATRSESGRRTTAARPSRQRGLRFGPWARGGRGRGAMRAVRRLVSSPPLPGPPLARAASRLASPGRRSAARPRALPPPSSVPSGRSRRCAATKMPENTGFRPYLIFIRNWHLALPFVDNWDL